jgi:hypothetical protein
MANLDLQLLNYKDDLLIKNIDGRPHIFDPVRRKNILVLPEEYVRQLIIVWLQKVVGIPTTLMALEKKIQLQEGYKRFDVVCYNRAMEPKILIECKSFDIALTESIARQISIYNQILKCPFLIITNGKESMIYNIDQEGNIKGLSSVESFIELLKDS